MVSLIRKSTDFMFAVPPVEQQYIPQWFRNSLKFSGPAAFKGSEYYVLYLIARAGFLIPLLYTMLSVWSRFSGRIIDLGFYKIDLIGESFVKMYLLSYKECVAPLLIWGVMPYYSAVWYYNFRTFIKKGVYIDPKFKDTFGFYGGFAVIFLATALAIYGCYGLFMLWVEQHHLEKSLLYFLFCGLVIPTMLSICTVMVFIMMIIFFSIMKARNDANVSNRL